MMFCQFCNREFKNNRSLKNHEIRCKANPNAIKIILDSNKQHIKTEELCYHGCW